MHTGARSDEACSCVRFFAEYVKRFYPPTHAPKTSVYISRNSGTTTDRRRNL